MSARLEDIARLNSWERRKTHRHQYNRDRMLCADCTLTPVVSPVERADYLLRLHAESVLSVAQVLARLTDQPATP